MIDPPIIRKPPSKRKKNSQSPAPKLIRGIIFFSNNSDWVREETVIRRINAFLPENNKLNFKSNQLLSHGWNIYRKLALKAINEFIISFPFIAHTPASLRSSFGMPTRKDRQRGKFSGISLISQALGWENPSHTNRESIPELPKGDLETLNKLLFSLKAVNKDFPISNDLISYINVHLNKNPLKDIVIPEINTHSTDSLEKTKSYLEKFDFINLNYDIQQDEEQFLTPDLIGSYGKQSKVVWVELKEWDPETNKKLFLKPLKQIFQYLTQVEIVVIICSDRLEFIKFLKKNQEWGIDILKDEIDKINYKFVETKDNIDVLRGDYVKIGRSMLKRNILDPKAEALLATIISSKTHEEIGVINTEVEAGEAINGIIEKNVQLWKKITIMDIQDIKTKEIPKENPVVIFGSMEK